MAGPASNFDGEIKKAMKGTNNMRGGGSAVAGPQQGKGSSTNNSPSPKAAQSSNKQNEWNQPPGPQGKDGMGPDNGGSVNGDTHAQMIAAGHAHMQAIHRHITAISSAAGGGGDGGVNQGTVIK